MIIYNTTYNVSNDKAIPFIKWLRTRYIPFATESKELKEAQSDVEKTEKKYKSLRDELDKLHEKEKEGTLTDSEQNRLTILENQTKQYERQLELKKQIAGNKVDEYYHTVDPSKL